MVREVTGDRNGAGLKVAIVVARYNERYTRALLHGALRALGECGVKSSAIDVAWVPGSFEIPVIAKRQAQSGDYDVVICLGCVIRSDTPHFEYVAGEAARGIMEAGLQSGVPVVFGVLTLNDEEQAEVRTRPDDTNRGYQAGLVGVEMATLLKLLR